MLKLQATNNNGYVQFVDVQTPKQTEPFKVSGFRQHAEGSFSFYGRPNTPHCGPKTSSLPIRILADYEVDVQYSPNALDPQGFLLDNLWFGQYFAAFKDAQIGISCEKLASLIASDICSELQGRLCDCNAVKVRIKPVTGVWIECALHPSPDDSLS